MRFCGLLWPLMTSKLRGGKNVSKKHCRSRPGRLLSNSRNAKPGPVCEPRLVDWLLQLFMLLVESDHLEFRYFNLLKSYVEILI
ncbi:hypothetical protein Hanom_Chr04g00381581 [Helianthus anomalus]